MWRVPTKPKPREHGESNGSPCTRSSDQGSPTRSDRHKWNPGAPGGWPTVDHLCDSSSPLFFLPSSDPPVSRPPEASETGRCPRSRGGAETRLWKGVLTECCGGWGFSSRGTPFRSVREEEGRVGAAVLTAPLPFRPGLPDTRT